MVQYVSMDDLVFIDTETTGIDMLVDRLVQICYKFQDKVYAQYFKSSVPISIKSMSISHITNKMVEKMPEFSYSEMKKDLQKILDKNILVAHNAVFDMDMLAKEGILTEKYIDTLKIARFCDTKNEIPEYNLQYLRYYFGIEIKAPAHDAKGDVLVLEAVFKVLFNKMLEDIGDEGEVIEKMVGVSKTPLLFQVFNYGKHKGKKLEEVASYDRSYLEWMLEQKLQSENLEEDWIYTLKHYLKVS